MRKWTLERNADINAYEVSDDSRIWCLTLKDEAMAQFIGAILHIPRLGNP